MDAIWNFFRRIFRIPLVIRRLCSSLTSESLIEAIHEHNLEVVKEHLELGIDVNKCDKEGFCPLYVALMVPQDVEIIKLLLEYKADINWCDYFGTNMLERAFLLGQIEAVQLLLEYKASTEHWPSHIKIEISNNIYGFLLKRLENFNVEKTNYPTVLQFMILHDEDMAMDLLDGGFEFELNAVNYDYGDDVTLINVAVRYSSAKIVKKLIELGADVDKTFYSVKSPLELATERGDPTILQLLKETQSSPRHSSH